jgi:hypothetical protein
VVLPERPGKASFDHDPIQGSSLLSTSPVFRLSTARRWRARHPA